MRTKGCLSNKTALAMIFKLAQATEKSWRRLDGQNQLPKVISMLHSMTELKSFKLPLDLVRHQHLTIAHQPPEMSVTPCNAGAIHTGHMRGKSMPRTHLS
jgi:hypothetical protein